MRQATPATPTSPSSFVCRWVGPEEPSTFHLRLCWAAHGRAFPLYLLTLWTAYDQLEQQLLAVEDTDPDEYLRLDAQLALIQEQIGWVSRQKDYPMPTDNIPVGKPTNQIDFAAAKERISLVDYISQYTVLRSAGATMKGRCPLPGHDDSTASLTVYPATNSWWCFGCRQGRDVFDFAAKMEGLRAGEVAGR